MDDIYQSNSYKREVEVTNENQKLSFHKKRYMEHVKKHKFNMNDIYEIERIKKFFVKRKMKIIKLNHSFDADIQRFTQF